MGGDANRLLNFARALDRSRFEHTVLTLVPPDHEEDRQVGLMKPFFDKYQIPVEHLGEPPRSLRRRTQRGLSLLLADTRSFVRVMRRLVRYLREHEIDIVDARMTYATLFGLMAGRLTGAAAVVSTVYGLDENWHSPLRNAIARGMFSQVDAIVSDSSQAIEVYQHWLPRAHRRTFVIPNGIFAPAPEKGRVEMRRFFGLPEDSGVRVIGQVSRLIHYKGHRVLLDAAHQVLKQEPRTFFLLCGHPHPPQYLEELRHKAASLGIGDRVRIASYAGPIADVWATIDLHVHASLLDSSPIAILESMALGLPAVVSGVGGIPDLVRDGETALVVPPGDAGALAVALMRVLGDPALAKSLGDRASERFEAHYQASIMARALENLFLTLLAERRGAAQLTGGLEHA
jgi:glycosyltransferase involved in cell wall biosynthesis